MAIAIFQTGGGGKTIETGTVTLDPTKTSYVIPEGLHSGNGAVQILTEEKSVSPSWYEKTVTPSSGKVLSKVSVVPASLQTITFPTYTNGGNGHYRWRIPAAYTDYRFVSFNLTVRLENLGANIWGGGYCCFYVNSGKVWSADYSRQPKYYAQMYANFVCTPIALNALEFEMYEQHDWENVKITGTMLGLN